MTKSYFTNLQNVVIDNLRMAQKSLEIAMAWISLDVYLGIYV